MANKELGVLLGLEIGAVDLQKVQQQIAHLKELVSTPIPIKFNIDTSQIKKQVQSELSAHPIKARVESVTGITKMSSEEKAYEKLFTTQEMKQQELHQKRLAQIEKEKQKELEKAAVLEQKQMVASQKLIANNTRAQQEQLKSLSVMLSDPKKANLIGGNANLSAQFKDLTSMLSVGAEDFNKIDFNSKLKMFNSDLKIAQNETRTFGDNILETGKKFASWLVTGNTLMQSLRFLKDGIETVREMDRAITNLQIITGESNASAREAVATYNQLAIALGVTTKEVAAGAEEWLNAS